MYIGQKIRLREYRREDIQTRLMYINDPGICMNLTPDIPYPITAHEENKWFEAITAEKDTYKFAIEDIESGKFIGGCSINSVDWKNSVAVVGIFIGSKEHRSKGYGTDAMLVLLRFIFMQMNLHKVSLTTYSFNEGAKRCYEKCGFTVEGILRQEIYKDGQYFDKIAMGLLREEYFANNQFKLPV